MNNSICMRYSDIDERANISIFRLTKYSRLLVIVISMLFSHNSYAVEMHELNRARQVRYDQLIHSLKCVQCESSNLADSEAIIAGNMKHYIRKRLREGQSDAEIIAYLTKRYGEQINTRPRFAGKTLWLWLIPPVVFSIGMSMLYFRFRRLKQHF